MILRPPWSPMCLLFLTLGLASCGSSTCKFSVRRQISIADSGKVDVSNTLSSDGSFVLVVGSRVCGTSAFDTTLDDAIFLVPAARLNLSHLREEDRLALVPGGFSEPTYLEFGQNPRVTYSTSDRMVEQKTALHGRTIEYEAR